MEEAEAGEVGSGPEPRPLTGAKLYVGRNSANCGRAANTRRQLLKRRRGGGDRKKKKFE